MAKFKTEDIQNEAHTYGWELLSEKYKNLDTELEFKCPKGHNVITTYAIWRTDHRCPVCDKPELDLADRVVAKKRGSYRILALDQATKITGWALYEDERIIKYGLAKFEQGETDHRISQMEHWLTSMITIWRPDKVIMEDIQLQPSLKGTRTYDNDDGNSVVSVLTFKSLAQLQGVFANCLYNNNIEYEFVAPSVWRELNHISGKYRAEKKKSAQLKVKEWFDIDVSNDEADAICIGRYAIIQNKKKAELLTWG